MIPEKNTGFGSDISPDIVLENVHEDVKTIAVVMDDLDVPFRREYTHWLIWNIPATSYIPPNIPAGEQIVDPFSALQGVAFGKHCYKGPKQPPFIKKEHRYQFNVYALDEFLDLPACSGKRCLMKAMKGHILQQAMYTGRYKPE